MIDVNMHLCYTIKQFTDEITFNTKIDCITEKILAPYVGVSQNTSGQFVNSNEPM